LKQIEKKK